MDRRIREYQTTLEATAATHFLVDYRFRSAPDVTLEQAAFNILSVSSSGNLAVLPFQAGHDRGLIRSSVAEFGGYQLLQRDAGSVTIAFPLSHCTSAESLPGLLQLIGAGAEYSYTEEYWVERLTLPPGFVERYQGPRFGVDRWRERLGVFQRSVLGVTIGPRFGVQLAHAAAAARGALMGGCDVVCDDVLLNAPEGEMAFERRVPAMVELCAEATRETGQKKSYFCLVLGTPRATISRAEWAIDCGVDAIITNAASLGLGGLEDLTGALTESGRSVPVITTNMGIALTSRAPSDATDRLSQTGMSEAVFAKLCRVAGADGVHTGTVGAECYGEMEWNRTMRSVRERLGHLEPCFAVAAGNLGLGQVWENISQLGPDVMLEVSSGILNYPGGPEPGARAFRRLIDGLDPTMMTDAEAESFIESLAGKDKTMRQVLNTSTP